jgi:hypothetical protein
MSKPFQRGVGDWLQYRSMFNSSEIKVVDLHFGKGSKPHYEAMAEIEQPVGRRLREAQRDGLLYDVYTRLAHVTGWTDHCALCSPRIHAFEGGNVAYRTKTLHSTSDRVRRKDPSPIGYAG